MPGSYPRTENDVYTGGREAATEETSNALERVARLAKPVRDAASAEARTVREVQAGKPGAWSNELLQPAPNTTYRVTSETSALKMAFATDAAGRTVSVSVRGEPGQADWAVGQKYPGHREIYQAAERHWKQSRVGKTGALGDVGFHLIAACFGGPAESINVVAGSSRLNVKEYAKIERTYGVFLLKGTGLDLTVDVKYEGASDRPASFRVRFENDYFVFDEELSNA